MQTSYAATSTPHIAAQAGDEAQSLAAVHTYIQITDSCVWDWSGGCVNARSEPSASSSTVLPLRNGMVLEVATTTREDSDGRIWYQVIFGEWLRYSDRLPQTFYVAADYVHAFTEPVETVEASTTKRIVIDRSEQKLYAYDGDALFMEVPVSTGLDLTPTPRGSFTVYGKTPSRYMQGPLPGISDQYYDLPGVPWDLYFTPEGGAIHGAYWHDHFGEQWSHGCVNMPLDDAKKLYDWTPLGTSVTVHD